MKFTTMKFKPLPSKNTAKPAAVPTTNAGLSNKERLKKMIAFKKKFGKPQQAQPSVVKPQPKSNLKAKPVAIKVRTVISRVEYGQRLIAKLPKVSDDVMKLRILVPTSEVVHAAWMKHTQVPLRTGEKVIVREVREGGYVKVAHGPADNRTESVFAIDHFTKLDGSRIYHRPMSEYIRTIQIETGILVLDPPKRANDKPYTIKRIIKTGGKK